MNTDNMKTLTVGNTVHLSVLNNGVALICLDMKDSKVNLLSFAAMNELSLALDELAGMKGLNGLVIYSGKESNFIAGANVNEIAGIQYQPSGVAYQATQNGKALLSKIRALKCRTVAAVNGSCRGGGTELLLFCDEILLSNSKKTTIGLPEGGLGFLPGFGGNVLLPKRIGIQSALDMILQPLRSWDAAKCWRNGLASEVVPVDQLLQRAVAVALGAKTVRAKQSVKTRFMNFLLEGNAIGRGLLRKGAMARILKETAGNYPAPIKSLDVALAAVTMPEDQAFSYESRAFAELCVSNVSRNLVRFFLARENANKLPEGLRPSVDVKTIGVLGCGVMGSGIVFVAANAGYNVVVREAYPPAMKTAPGSVKALFDKLVEKGKMTREEADRVFGAIKFTAEYTDLADCDLVIEAIPEKMELKQESVREVEKVIKKNFIFATNTSSLSITEIASASAHPERVVGLHFFNPAHIMELVEAIPGEHTSSETVAAVKMLSDRLGKKVVVSKNSPSFIVNRILVPYLYEAIKLFEQGVPGVDIDKAMVKFGMKMGPLTLLDEIGLDTASHVINVMHEAFGERFAPSSIVQFFKEAKLLGKKSGKGFYLYDAQGKQLGLNPEMVARAGGQVVTKKPEEIQDRLALVMVNEAALCVAEGVPDSASDLDLSMVLGTGFAPFRGGVCAYADVLGARTVVQKLEVLTLVAGDNYRPAPILKEMAHSGRTFYQS